MLHVACSSNRLDQSLVAQPQLVEVADGTVEANEDIALLQVEMRNRFWGNLCAEALINTSENVVGIQLWITLIANMLLKAIQKNEEYKWHLPNLIFIQSINLYLTKSETIHRIAI
jgi:hypothetical protein